MKPSLHPSDPKGLVPLT